MNEGKRRGLSIPSFLLAHSLSFSIRFFFLAALLSSIALLASLILCYSPGATASNSVEKLRTNESERRKRKRNTPLPLSLSLSLSRSLFESSSSSLLLLSHLHWDAKRLIPPNKTDKFLFFFLLLSFEVDERQEFFFYLNENIFEFSLSIPPFSRLYRPEKPLVRCKCYSSSW